MLLYYITDRRSFPGGEAVQRTAVLRKIAEAAGAGVDYIQLREKDLSARELERLTRDALQAVSDNSTKTQLLINARTDIALACGVDGVHLPGGELPASEVRALWSKAGGRDPLIGVSAHSSADVRYAEAHGANFAVLAPVFEKVHTGVAAVGLDGLRAACSSLGAVGNVEGGYSGSLAVLALGGVNLANAADCVRVGAAGVAGIRLFQAGDVRETVRRLREL